MKIRFGQHIAVGKALSLIWKNYGSCKALLSSPFLHFSAFLTLASVGAWVSKDWWNTGMSVIPGLLGFSVATFAVFVAIGDEKFRATLASGGEKPAGALLGIYSSFLVLIGVQVVALLYSMFASSRPLTFVVSALGAEVGTLPLYVQRILSIAALTFRFIGWLLIVYSIVAIVPMSLSVFRMAKLYLGHLLKFGGKG